MAEQTLENSLDANDLQKEMDRDLGFGTVVSGQSRERLLNADGTFNVQRTGLPLLTSLNLYHTLLSMSWRTFLLLVLLLYFVSNIAFGALYASFGASALVDTSAEPMANIFLRGFFFSVQTFATIGYGTIHPAGIVPNLLVTIESYYSLIANALITGVVFARFARPTAKVIFSNVAVIAPYHDMQGLMFRIVNGRNNQLIEVELKKIKAADAAAILILKMSKENFDLDLDVLFEVDDEEIDVVHRAAHFVALQFLHDGRVGLAVDFDGEQRV